MTTSKKIVGIEALRFFAAFLVLLQHAYYFAGISGGDEVMSFRQLKLGNLGVNIFFAISGCVMALSSFHTTARKFALSRLLRIYPPFLLSLTFATVLFEFLLPSPPPYHFDFSLLLFPTGTLVNTFHVPYWTLIYEIFFYFIIFLLILFRFPYNARPWLFILWNIVILNCYCQ